MSGETFPWRDTGARLAALWRAHDLRHDPRIRGFVATTENGELRFVPPPSLPIDPDEPDPARYLERLPERLGRICIVLVHAGATALGVFEDDADWIAHKVIKKYVVRGHGKAQPLHRKTKGKSRYGSRLRLQNFESQLGATNEKLNEWWRDFGPFDRVFRFVPPRVAPDLDAASPSPPWGGEFVVEPIRFHVHVPDFAELKRVRWKLTHGEIVRQVPAS